MEYKVIKDEDDNKRRIRSFVIRAGRMTEAQTNAFKSLGPKYLIDVQDLKKIDFAKEFNRNAKLIVEIGFGMGQSFIEMAKNDKDNNYLGIEVHPPGVGATLLKIEDEKLNNVRLIHFDAFSVLTDCIEDESIDALQIFFPDPWPKARHHKRRLINDNFINLVRNKIKHGGEIRLATDWENYAEEMLLCLNRAEGFHNLSEDGGFIPRPSYRPFTKFEQRGERLGHGVWDLVFIRD